MDPELLQRLLLALTQHPELGQQKPDAAAFPVPHPKRTELVSPELNMGSPGYLDSLAYIVGAYPSEVKLEKMKDWEGGDYDYNTHSIRVNSLNNNRPALQRQVLAHEMGHVMEFQNPAQAYGHSGGFWTNTEDDPSYVENRWHLDGDLDEALADAFANSVAHEAPEQSRKTNDEYTMGYLSKLAKDVPTERWAAYNQLVRDKLQQLGLVQRLLSPK